MDRMTARNIALISPMRSGFAALSAASAFAAGIIAKYSGTEPFPVSGESLVYFDALKRQLDDEKQLKQSVNYTLRLLIIRRLVADGRITDPTVSGRFLPAVNERIEQNLNYLRITDSNAYERIVRAMTYIENTRELGDDIFVSQISEGARIYNYTSFDIGSFADRFFGERSEGHAYSGSYAYSALPALVYKRESAENDGSASPGKDEYDRQSFTYNTEKNVSEITQNNVINAGSESVTNNAESVVNVGDKNYNYNSENLTYNTEKNTFETTQNNTVNAGSESVTNNAGNVVNVGDSNYNYNSEKLTYNTEKNVSETTQNNVINAGSENVTNNAGNVVNVGDSNYNYNSEKLTYTTEKNISEITQNNTVNAGSENVTNNEYSAEKTAAGARQTDLTDRADGIPTLAEFIADTGKTERADDVSEIGLPMMNTFLSGGSEYMNSVRTKYLHRVPELVPAATDSLSTLGQLLGSPRSSFGTVSYALELLLSEREPDLRERGIYEQAVVQVFLKRHSGETAGTRDMLARLNSVERTEVLTLIVNRLADSSGAVRGADAGSVSGAAASHKTERSSLRNVLESFVNLLRTVPARREQQKMHTVSEEETKLLRMLAADKNAVRLTGNEADVNAERDTIAARLVRLYNDIHYSRDERLLRRVRESIPDIGGAAQSERPISRGSGAEMRDVSRNLSDRGEFWHSFVQPTLRLNTAERNPESAGSDAPVGVRIAAKRLAAARRFAAEPLKRYKSPERGQNSGTAETYGYTVPPEVFAGYVDSPAVRKALAAQESVRYALERIAGYEAVLRRVNGRAAEKTQRPPGIEVPGTPGTIVGYGENALSAASDRNGKDGLPGRQGASGVSGADGADGTNGINGQPGANGLDGRSGETRYAPTVTVYGAGEVRLLPVYALDGIIFPAVPDRIPGMVRLNTAASAARNVSVHREDMPVLRDRSIKPAARQKTDEADTRTAAPAMNAETVMRYRDPITPEQNRQIPASADTPDRNELISRFGNLIEGADAVMNGSFRSGTGIGRETMAVIEQTAEKTALNSKMIEEIREQQRKLESVTLRSSDLDTISEELIRKLRSRMRLDRSRYAGQ